MDENEAPRSSLLSETVASAERAGSYGIFGERESNLASLLSTHHSAWKSNTLLVAASFYAAMS